jgi:hypothetical protein
MKAQLKTPRQRKTHELSCPFCGAGIELAERDLVDGGEVECSHCREAATLISERVAHSNQYQWTLIQPETDDERR